MRWHRVEPGQYASDAGWHIERHEGYLEGVRISRWWSPYSPDDDRPDGAEQSFRTLKEAKEYAEKQAEESGIPYEWGKDADGSGDLWTVRTPFLFHIKKAAKGCYRLIDCNDDNKDVGVFPTVKQAKEAAEAYIPAAN